MAKITITNVLTKVISDATGVEAVISPTGITKPCTPIQEYVGDMATIVNGTLLIPAYNKVQMLSIPFGAKFTFDATDAREINYWENMKVNGAEIEVDQAGQAESTGLSLVEEYTYTKVVFSGTGTEQDPYVPAFAASTFYKVEGNAYVLVSSAPEDWGTGDYYTRKKNVLPTNDKQGE